MTANGIQGAKRRGKPWLTTKPHHEASQRADLVERDFIAELPDRLWAADLTLPSHLGGDGFLAFVIDVFSRVVVVWQLACHMPHRPRPRRAARGAFGRPAQDPW